MIKIQIVDDHKLIIEAWSSLLDQIEGFQVVKKTSSAKDTIENALVYRPDIILLDINLGKDNGIELCEQIVNTLPKTKVIGLSLHDKVSIVKKFLSMGASGYLTKNVSPDELVKAIIEVHNGGNYICTEVQQKFSQQLFGSTSSDNEPELTAKEIEVLRYIAKGLTSKEIADELFLSQRTIETHRHNILKKLQLPNSARLISWAIQNGYLS